MVRIFSEEIHACLPSLDGYGVVGSFCRVWGESFRGQRRGKRIPAELTTKFDWHADCCQKRRRR